VDINWEALKDNWGKITGLGLGASGGIMFLAKDAIREWWAERRLAQKAALEERAAERKAVAEERKIAQGFGDKLADELLEILREDLKSNAALLKDLTLTMNDFRDIMRVQKEQGIEILAIAKETRESQKWLERQYGRPQS